MTEINEPLVTMDSHGLHVASKKVSEKLLKKNISASLITGLEKCPASWLGDSFVIPEIIPTPPDNAGRRGNLFHKIMEDFFALEPLDRTKEALNVVTNDVLSSDEFKDMAEMPEAIEWLKMAIHNYYEMGAKPELVKVASIKDDKKGDKIGLEVFVKGSIGGTKRSVLGFIDRLVVDQNSSEDAVVIEDWKTGATVKRWNPKNKDNKGFAEVRQQVIYSMLLKEQGINVSKARLIFPVVKEIVNINVHNEAVIKRVTEDVKITDDKLDLFIDRNTFEYQPSFLCAWCPLAKICPAAMIRPYEKMRNAYSAQPSIGLLSKAIELV